MFTLKVENHNTLEIIENYISDFNIAHLLFEDRYTAFDIADFHNYSMELLNENGACLAYADDGTNGGLLWKIEEVEGEEWDEEWGDWDWALLEEWAKNGISAPIPKSECEDDEDFEDYEDYEDYYHDFYGNYHCDSYGVCGGTSCPNYFECHR